MRHVQPRMANFRVTLLTGWIALATAAMFFARSRGIGPLIAIPVGFAFLTEFTFYLAAGFASAREWLSQRFDPVQLATLLTAATLLVYLIYAVPTGLFAWRPFGALVLLSVSAGFWHVLLKRRWSDLLYLAMLAAVIVSGVLKWIYPGPTPKLPLDILGHVSLVRTAVLSFLLIRREDSAGYGFVPDLRSLRIGAFGFVLLILAVGPLAFFLGQARWTGRTPAVLPALGSLLGIYWVLALSEEFFFRGLLMRWLTRWTNATFGLVFSSMLFGACHLGFKGAFPNWRMALLAAAAGLFYGEVFRRAGTIRASMVTHALTVASWKLFFS